MKLSILGETLDSTQVLFPTHRRWVTGGSSDSAARLPRASNEEESDLTLSHIPILKNPMMRRTRDMGSAGSLTHDKAVVGTPAYTSPEMIKLAFQGTPRTPSELGRKPLPRFKYLAPEVAWSKDPETLVHAVLKRHLSDGLTWDNIWEKTNTELLRYKEANEDFEIPSHDDTLMGLHRLVKRGVVEITGGPQPQYQLSV